MTTSLVRNASRCSTVPKSRRFPSLPRDRDCVSRTGSPHGRRGRAGGLIFLFAWLFHCIASSYSRVEASGAYCPRLFLTGRALYFAPCTLFRLSLLSYIFSTTV